MIKVAVVEDDTEYAQILLSYVILCLPAVYEICA